MHFGGAFRNGLRVAALAVAAGGAACSTAGRYEGSPGLAVVIYEPTREHDAEVAAALLRSKNWAVHTASAGVAHRARSSLAVYGQRHRQGRGLDLAEPLRQNVGEIEVLPFLTPGPGEHDVVLWLADPKP